VHGLGTRNWLAADLVRDERDETGTLEVLDAPGLGCDPGHFGAIEAPNADGIWRARSVAGANP
jgi:hypothetical protein